MKKLVFLLFLFCVGIFAVASHHTEKSQANLKALGEQATQVIANDPQQRFPLVKVRREHLDLILEGNVIDERSLEEAVNLLRNGDKEAEIKGVSAGIIRDGVDLMILKRPVIRAELSPGGVIRVEGEVPTDELKSALREALEGLSGINPYMSGLKVSRHVEGDPWLQNLPGLMAKFFHGAKEGIFDLTKDRLLLRRRLDDPNWRDALKTEARRLVPPDISVVEQFTMEESPSELVLQKDEGIWTLSGEVPDKATQDAILKAIREAEASLSIAESDLDFSALEIKPALAKVSWVNGFPDFLRVFLREVRSNQHITVIGDHVILRGEVPHAAARTSITMAGERAFPSPFRIDNRCLAAGKSTLGLLPLGPVDPSNPLRKLSFEMKDTGVGVTGMVPDSGTKARIEEGLRLAYPAKSIKNQLTVDRRAKPEAWVNNLGGFFRDYAARSLGSGTVKLSGREVELTGVVRNAITRDALGTRLEKALGNSFTVFNRMEIDPGKGGSGYESIRVYFKWASSKLDPSEAPKLSEAARAIQRIKGTPTVLIKGFASSVGSPEKNAIISQKRANAVKEELIRLGVPEESLVMKPVGSSEAAGGDRAEDRRVELIILD